ncbi:MAG: DNA replication/repair protein RecF [Bacilli bacterium]|nr:DNA replication/repair protein RecF [Bacilli bacterium]
MYLKKLNLINFRNYKRVDLSLGSKINVFVGDNAQGKTNILESILVLALTKSFRGSLDSELIRFGAVKSKIKCKVMNEGLLKNLEVSIENGKKGFKVNNTNIYKISDYISNLSVICFSPDDLNIVKDAPSVRRNILNIQISQLSRNYLNTYNEYNKLLKTRNEYLKLLLTSSIADKKYLDIITDKLIEKALIIYNERKLYIDAINENINGIYNDITGDDGLRVCYYPNVDFSSYDVSYMKEKLNDIYQKNYRKELNAGMTLYGPHRDDFSFYLNDNNLKLFGSQGQQRVAIISFKLSEISIFENRHGTKPVLLFDDIFSELDIKKRNRLMKFISNDIQAIITTTDLKNIQKKYLNDSIIFDVENGNIIRK